MDGWAAMCLGQPFRPSRIVQMQLGGSSQPLSSLGQRGSRRAGVHPAPHRSRRHPCQPPGVAVFLPLVFISLGWLWGHLWSLYPMT